MLKDDYRPEGDRREKADNKEGKHNVFWNSMYFISLHGFQIIAYRRVYLSQSFIVLAACELPITTHVSGTGEGVLFSISLLARRVIKVREGCPEGFLAVLEAYLSKQIFALRWGQPVYKTVHHSLVF